jgi:hypothetical protein
MDNLRTLRAQWEDRLRGIAVPQPFSLTAFAAEVARHRRRRLQILDLPEQASGSPVSGVWLATDRADLIYLEPTASPFHRGLICLHEIGHMLCDHHASARLGCDDLLRGLFPHLSPDLLRRVLARHGYTSREELEAETAAAIILDRAETGPPPRADLDGPSLLPRLGEALRHPLRHV